MSREIFISEPLKFWILFSIQKVRLDHEKARKKISSQNLFPIKSYVVFNFTKTWQKLRDKSMRDKIRDKSYSAQNLESEIYKINQNLDNLKFRKSEI